MSEIYVKNKRIANELKSIKQIFVVITTKCPSINENIYQIHRHIVKIQHSYIKIFLN